MKELVQVAIESLYTVIGVLNKLTEHIEVKESKPKIVLEAMIQSLDITDRHVRIDTFNTSLCNLEHLDEIVKRNYVKKESYAIVGYPPKIRITVERIDK